MTEQEHRHLTDHLTDCGIWSDIRQVIKSRRKRIREWYQMVREYDAVLVTLAPEWYPPGQIRGCG